MPYRRFPKTDPARLKALRTLLDNNDIYTARNRFLDWGLIGRAQPLHDRLLTATEQHRVTLAAQTRNAGKTLRLQRRAAMYVSHFLQVLFMAVERGEIKRSQLALYGLEASATAVPFIKTADTLLQWGQRVIDGEKARIKAGGRPIYNPSIGMVSTHYDIFREANEAQRRLQQRTAKALQDIADIRPECDELLQKLWNQIEDHYGHLDWNERVMACRKLGVIYYYRRHEPLLPCDQKEAETAQKQPTDN